MRELLDDIQRWRRAGKRVAIARVVEVEGSGPREVGATMATNEDGEVAGSVSGGCVEGAVVTEASGVLDDGVPRLVTYGIADDDAFAVGLTCGGTLHVFIEQLALEAGVVPAGAGSSLNIHSLEVLEEAIRSEEPVVLATVTRGGGVGAALVVRPGSKPLGTLGDPDLDRVVARDAQGELAAGRTSSRHYGLHGEARGEEVAIFIQSFAPPPRMVICGAVDFSAALAKVAKVLGYRVTICDARAVFATAQRFPMADEVVADWPDRMLSLMDPPLGQRDALCVLTHDPKFDVPAILAGLATEVGYLGVMGSRRTHADRLRRLREAEVNEGALDRLHAPIGLDLGGRTPEETAISICAEIVAERTGRTAAPLRFLSGPLHGTGPAVARS